MIKVTKHERLRGHLINHSFLLCVLNVLMCFLFLEWKVYEIDFLFFR